MLRHRISPQTRLAARCCVMVLLTVSVAAQEASQLHVHEPESGGIHISVGDNDNERSPSHPHDACDAGAKTVRINDEPEPSRGDRALNCLEGEYPSNGDDGALRELRLLKNGLSAWFQQAFTLEGFSRLSTEQVKKKEQAASKEKESDKKRGEKNVSVNDLRGGGFDGRFDGKSLPHSEGTLTLRPESARPGSLLESAVSVSGSFSHGLPVGAASVLYANGTVLLARFEDGSIQGFALNVSNERHFVAVHFYEDGKRRNDIQISWEFGVLSFREGANTLLVYLGPPHSELEPESESEPSDCAPLLLTREADGATATRHVTTSWQNSSFPWRLHVTPLSPAGAQGLTLPNHLSALDGDDAAVALAALYSLRCRRKLSKMPKDGALQNAAAIKKMQYEQLRELEEEMDDHDENGKHFYEFVLKEKGRERLEALSGDPACLRQLRAVAQWPPQSALVRTTMASFPGSGAKWVLDLVTEATGIGAHNRKHPTPTRALDVDTGAVYTTHHHLPNAILMSRRGQPRVLEPMRLRLWHVTLTHGRTVLLLRSPFEAVVSFWRHISVNIYVGKISQERSETASALSAFEASLSTPAFATFALNEVRLWRQLALDHISMATNLHVVHFDRLKSDTDAELRRLIAFLGLPIIEERLSCLRLHPILTTKRASLSLVGSLSAELRQAFEAAIRDVNQELVLRGQEPMPILHVKLDPEPK